MNTKEIFELYNELRTYAETARQLGVDPRTVRRHVEKYTNENSLAASESTRTGIPFGRVSHYWLKTRNEEGDDVSLFVKNKEDVMEYEELRNALIEDLKEFAPVVEKIDRVELPVEKQHLLVIDPADIHIGKLAMTEETDHGFYDINEAYRRVYWGVEDILNKAKSFGIHHILLVVGNDILHIDETKRTTTGGTPQDTDSQWWDMFETARNLYVEVIERCKLEADVTIVFCPSNHDFKLGFGVIDSLFSWYRNDANVTISNYGKSMRHRKYIKYGVNLIGVTHGDGAKTKDLTSLMQYEARDEWAETEFSYWYIHHLHHKFRLINSIEVEKDYNGVTVIGSYGDLGAKNNTSVECIRSPSEPDAWHSRKGYLNRAAIEAFIHHPTEGQVARITSYC